MNTPQTAAGSLLALGALGAGSTDALPGLVGADVHLAEPAETAARRGNKKRAKTDRSDVATLRELLMIGRLPESWKARAEGLTTATYSVGDEEEERRPSHHDRATRPRAIGLDSDCFDKLRGRQGL